MGVTPPTRESRDVHIKVPANAGYLVLARLALSAICRLTPLGHNEVADLKLAVTEAASRFVGNGTGSESQIEFFFRLADDRLEMELRGSDADVPDAELELSRAIVEATVDSAELGGSRTLLVKQLPTG
jgi:anti-sigma regulatory factor (Ser/Thr protein kinase)